MIELYPRLFVGNQDDYEFNVVRQIDWAVVHACKEPYHRKALGYTGRAAPKDHPEYLLAKRDNRLILNLVDAADPAYIPDVIIDSALHFVQDTLSESKKILIHCNQGMSRSPCIGLLYLVAYTDELPKESFIKAEEAFREIYPFYHPADGIRKFMQLNWEKYKASKL